MAAVSRSEGCMEGMGKGGRGKGKERERQIK